MASTSSPSGGSVALIGRAGRGRRDNIGDAGFLAIPHHSAGRRLGRLERTGNRCAFTEHDLPELGVRHELALAWVARIINGVAHGSPISSRIGDERRASRWRSVVRSRSSRFHSG